MAIHPDSSFPLLAKDQAEVIRIFLELMRKRSERASEFTFNHPLEPGIRSGYPRRPGEFPDFEHPYEL